MEPDNTPAHCPAAPGDQPKPRPTAPRVQRKSRPARSYESIPKNAHKSAQKILQPPPVQKWEEYINIANENQMQILSIPLAPVDPSAHMLYKCSHGHLWSRPFSHGPRCDVCHMIKLMEPHSPNVICIEDGVLTEKSEYTFKCAQGHRFLQRIEITPRGCPVCIIIQHTACFGKNYIVDLTSIYVDQHTRLRFHCNTLRHNPHCSNRECILRRHYNGGPGRAGFHYDPKCVELVPCNQDFYASPLEIHGRAINACDHNHTPLGCKPAVHRTIRAFEMLFEDRFDDPTYEFNVRVTGYNMILGIAYIHEQDIPAPMISAAHRWAAQASVYLLVIPEAMIKTRDIAKFIIKHMLERNYLEGNPNEIYNRFDLKLSIFNEAGKLYVDRCITDVRLAEQRISERVYAARNITVQSMCGVCNVDDDITMVSDISQ